MIKCGCVLLLLSLLLLCYNTKLNKQTANTKFGVQTTSNRTYHAFDDCLGRFVLVHSWSSMDHESTKMHFYAFSPTSLSTESRDNTQRYSIFYHHRRRHMQFGVTLPHCTTTASPTPSPSVAFLSCFNLLELCASPIFIAPWILSNIHLVCGY